MLRLGGGGAAPVWRVYEPKKTGARSARARTRGQNQLVENNIVYSRRRSVLLTNRKTYVWLKNILYII
jgi:hypothetical protein